MSSFVKMLQFFDQKDGKCYMISEICPSENCEKRLKSGYGTHQAGK